MRENPDERLTGEMILGQENMTFRFAQKEDAALILHFIRELAKYEKRPDQVFATEEMITEWLFEKERAEAFFLVVDGKEIGYALFFHNFSTFSGRGGIYLEDLYVDPAFRGRGYGKASLQQLARIASERGCNHLTDGMDLSGLEQAEPGLLPVTRCASQRGLCRFPSGRGCAQQASRIGTDKTC